MNSPPTPVLIVDDDRTIAIMLKGLLRKLEPELRCDAQWVETGSTVLAEVARLQPQLVLLDYQLPDVDGLTLLTQLCALPPTQRPAVIMLTGSGNEHIAVEAMKCGAKDYLTKSGMNLPAMRRAILGALERRQLEERLAHSTQELQEKNAQMETDLATAREVQQALLPHHFPKVRAPSPHGPDALRFHHRWIPSSAVAGDFSAAFPVGDAAAGVLVCDVMGHGVRSALVAALVHGLVRELRPVAASPGDFLTGLNLGLQTMLARANNLVFVTAAYLVVDPGRHELRFANAGHPHPLRLARSTGQVTPLLADDGPGPALGMLPGETYTTTVAPLARDDSVLLFTDGVTEAADAHGEEFGDERLRALLTQKLADATDAQLDGLLGELRKFRGYGPATPVAFSDDVCLLAVDCLV